MCDKELLVKLCVYHLINDSILKQVLSTEYLGVYIDQHLTNLEESYWLCCKKSKWEDLFY